MTSSKSLGSGLETTLNPKSVSNFDIAYSNPAQNAHVNGSHENFLLKEREAQGSNDTLTPHKSPRDELKANMNRIDSHHGNLEALGRAHDSH